VREIRTEDEVVSEMIYEDNQGLRVCRDTWVREVELWRRG